MRSWSVRSDPRTERELPEDIEHPLARHRIGIRVTMVAKWSVSGVTLGTWVARQPLEIGDERGHRRVTLDSHAALALPPGVRGPEGRTPSR